VALVLGGLVFGGALGGLNREFLGIEHVDHYGTQWFYWFAELTLRGEQSPLHTDRFFYPWGKDLYAHTGANMLDAWAAVPVRAIFGQVLGYNLFVLLGLAGNVWAFARLGREMSDDRVAVRVAAALFGFSPYCLFEAVEGRPTQAIVVLPVLFLRSTWRAGLRGGWRDPVLAGVLLALTGYQYWYYAFFGGFAALLLGLARTASPSDGAGTRVEVFARHALIAAVAGLLVAPAALPLLIETQVDADVPGMLDVSGWDLWSSPLVTGDGTTVGLSVWQPFLRESGFYLVLSEGVERFLPMGRPTTWGVLVGLSIWALRPGAVQRRVLLPALLGMALVATGPLVVVGQRLIPNLFYMELVRAVGFLQRLWWPSRAYLFIDLLLMVALTQALTALRARSSVLFLGATVLLTVELGAQLHRTSLLPYPTWISQVPAGYRCLADGPEGALIELPYAWTQAHLFYQTIHHRPILGGMIEDNAVFSPPEALELREKNTFVRRMREISELAGTDVVVTDEDRETVQTLGYRYVALQKDAFVVQVEEGTLRDNMDRIRLKRSRKALGDMLGTPVYEDARLAIYAPWGDPRPCAVGAVVEDEVAIGAVSLLKKNPSDAELAEQTLHRVWVKPAEPSATPAP
jgi:hypothetical protein